MAKACKNRGIPLKATISAERDKYLKHHKGYGGTAWVYLNNLNEAERVSQLIKSLDGIEEVIPRPEAVKRFSLAADRIGDLMVMGDKDTVFGQLVGESGEEIEQLEAGYRSHGSAHELEIPLVIYNWKGKLPGSNQFTHNVDLARFLYRM